MVERRSRLAQLSLQGSSYLFILINESDHQTAVQGPLDENAEKFGDNAGLTARLVRANRNSRQFHFDELFEKPWPSAVKDQMEKERAPFLVIIEGVDFDDFDPRNHAWRIVWISNAKTPQNSIPHFFDAIQQAITHEESPIEFLDRVADPQTGASLYGSISSFARPQAIALRQGPGRPGLMDPGYGVRDWIEDQWQQGNLRDHSRGWQKRVAVHLKREKPNLPWDEKSVVDRLRREGVFTEIIARQSGN